ncbi:GvpL/GvpF family gas vesicle protein [Actinomadura scrupuli]|uniref:GvpL/GvpF family gas vesicle protein n=1 Tax=Actinomadura scrupuli TaxID=559629 RepID=UPI003D96A044
MTTQRAKRQPETARSRTAEHETVRHEMTGPETTGRERTRPEPARGSAGEETPVCYVYGIVPADTRLPEGLTGTGGGEVSLIREGEVAGVVSELLPEGGLGTREDLLAHEGVVASLAEETTILPLRFGAVVTTADAVAEEMLVPYHDWFAAVLTELTGRRQFSILGAYVEDAVLREVLQEEPEVARLREKVRDLPEDAAYYDRIRLGELIVQALDDKRLADTEALVAALSPHADDVAAREPAGEDMAADVAFLVTDEQRPRFEQAVDELGDRWAGRIRLRMLGPLAPYDFVPSHPEEE